MRPSLRWYEWDGDGRAMKTQNTGNENDDLSDIAFAVWTHLYSFTCCLGHAGRRSRSPGGPPESAYAQCLAHPSRRPRSAAAPYQAGLPCLERILVEGSRHLR